MAEVVPNEPSVDDGAIEWKELRIKRTRQRRLIDEQQPELGHEWFWQIVAAGVVEDSAGREKRAGKLYDNLPPNLQAAIDDLAAALKAYVIATKYKSST